MKKQSQKDKDFIAKIATIGVIVKGVQSKDVPTCPDCGKPAVPVLAIAIPLRRKPKHDDSEEQSISA